MTSSRGPASGTSTIMTAAVGTTPPSPPKPAAVCTGGLMPPELLDVLAACPHTRTWKTPGRTAEPDLAGLRDRALLLVGFFAALRRSELAALTVDQVSEHPNGLVLTLPRSRPTSTASTRSWSCSPRRASRPLPGHRAARLARCRRNQRGSGAAPSQQGQPISPPPLAPRVGQHPPSKPRSRAPPDLAAARQALRSLIPRTESQRSVLKLAYTRDPPATVLGTDLGCQEIGEFLCGIGVELFVAIAGDQGESLSAGDDADRDAAGRVAWWGEPQLRWPGVGVAFETWWLRNAAEVRQHRGVDESITGEVYQSGHSSLDCQRRFFGGSKKVVQAIGTIVSAHLGGLLGHRCSCRGQVGSIVGLSRHGNHRREVADDIPQAVRGTDIHRHPDSDPISRRAVLGVPGLHG